MDNATINDQIVIDVPDGFHVMGKAELKEVYNDENVDRWGMVNKDDHMVVTVYWHKSSRLLSAIVNEAEVCKSTEKRLHKLLKNYDYELLGFFQRKVCGENASGFRHRYLLQGIPCISEVFVFKHGATCYTIYSYTREECEETNRPVLNEVIESIAYARWFIFQKVLILGTFSRIYTNNPQVFQELVLKGLRGRTFRWKAPTPFLIQVFVLGSVHSLILNWIEEYGVNQILQFRVCAVCECLDR